LFVIEGAAVSDARLFFGAQTLRVGGGAELVWFVELDGIEGGCRWVGSEKAGAVVQGASLEEEEGADVRVV
jgi:hypothetical protein